MLASLYSAPLIAAALLLEHIDFEARLGAVSRMSAHPEALERGSRAMLGRESQLGMG